MTYDNSARSTLFRADLRNIEPAAFAALGNDHVAYLRPILVNDKPGLEVHAADGRTLAVIHEPHDVAIAIIRQNDLEPLSLH